MLVENVPQAKAHGLGMVTRNGREFKRVAGLKVEGWEST